jgi:hypothetical protein
MISRNIKKQKKEQKASRSFLMLGILILKVGVSSLERTGSYK